MANNKVSINWDSSNMRSSYSNVINVSSTPNEFLLMFGMKQSSDSAPNNVKVQLSSRIVLSPYTVKNLVSILNNVIQEHEYKYGSIDLRASKDKGVRPASLHCPPPSSKSTKVTEKVNLLFQQMRSLNVQVGVEQSFKVSEKTLLGNRFLIGTSKDAIWDKPNEKILDICKQMAMPEDLLETFMEKLFDANYVHFGFEENKNTCLYKVYLEFWHNIKEELETKEARSKPFLMHLGFKWDAFNTSECALTTYNWYPLLSVENILTRVSNILDPAKYSTPFYITKSIVETASGRISHDDILYLEVTEEDNPRTSFDINLYKANLQLGELSPFLLKMCEHYLIPADKFNSFYEQVKTKTFGHISGGIDREGKDFLTIYYGVEGYFINQSQDHKYKSSLMKQGFPSSTGMDHTQSTNWPLFKTAKTEEKASLLVQLIKGLNIVYGFEHSFKIAHKILLTNRFLLGFQSNPTNPRLHEKVMNICEQINMPDDFLAIFQEHLAQSTIVLFGFEKNEDTSILKAYLEFGDKLKISYQDNADKAISFLIHLGFKWDLSDSTKRSIARYTCFPLFTVENMLDRISNVFYSQKYQGSFEIVKGIVLYAAKRAGNDKFLYFEAKEEDNPRTSFDINMYVANLQMAELYPFLLEMCRYYAIDFEEFNSLYDSVKTHQFGHLTGGLDRKERDFLTLYFSEMKKQKVKPV